MKETFNQNIQNHKSQFILKKVIRFFLITLMMRLVILGINSWPFAKRSIVNLYYTFSN